MDFFESTKIVFHRIQKLEAENVSKIIGYLLLEDQAQHEMIRLALGPDNMIQSLIDKAKRELGLSPKPGQLVSAARGKQPVVSNLPTNFTPFTPSSSRSPLPSAASQADNGQLDPLNHHLMHHMEYFPASHQDPAIGEYRPPNQPHFLPSEGQWQHYNLAGPYFQANHHCPELAKNPRTNQKFPVSPDRCPNLPQYTMNICEYFSKGYCKYGAYCRSLHVLQLANGHVMVLNPANAHFEIPNNDRVSPRGCLKELEMELTEILKTRRGLAVPLYSIPMLYHEKYGKVLQTENYLTENRRQCNVGYGLIQLLSRMTNIRLIDRPHGQHAVILVDDIPRYMRSLEERNEQEDTLGVSCQVYLTFPPQSEFSEEDVRCYFNNFGPVQEVKIPLQEKRMFGFVTFVHPETVRFILSKGNPHFIGGAQVLVKPYRPKITHVDRRLEERVDHNAARFSDAESNPIPIGGAGSSGVAGKCENNEKLLKNEASKEKPTVEVEKNGVEQSGYHSFFSYTIDDAIFGKGFLSNGEQPLMSGTDEVGCSGTSSEVVTLPDSPFTI